MTCAAKIVLNRVIALGRIVVMGSAYSFSGYANVQMNFAENIAVANIALTV